MKDRLVRLHTYRVYYRVGDEPIDVYTDAPSPQCAVNDICADNPDAIIIDVSKIVTGWKQPKKGTNNNVND